MRLARISVLRSDVYMSVPVPPTHAALKYRKYLDVSCVMLVILSFGHLIYGDGWGALLDIMFALLGYATFRRWLLSGIAFYSFLCAFNCGIDVVATINVGMSIEGMDRKTHDSLKLTSGLEAVILGTMVMDTLVMGACLVFSCKIYTDLRANLYSQLMSGGGTDATGASAFFLGADGQQGGATQQQQQPLGMPLLQEGQQSGGRQPQQVARQSMGYHQEAPQPFMPFQGQAHKLD
ncbi:hypothetical protein Pmar_PMAR020545 [Perkinsus marinus ATCC 50983]|uniref:Uncharacterized protein n=1 Tax=Perkinsus marinus (strain ATCC 50983 / TXsc) TaxID=423536 RepID=C5L7B9_PERM5|nr:hypothetical protein Pmar_PMAR020545 [Perkinsus marinus ATCC 50983]EER07381.1 hypothetical protein Pmar_PMAR020545 [Perkinsus marinus ATCC 50983]|eukprot:XP_002775565.1 hypothetical protein Pmar_PMAR020545 [Perkinsus marinus ATCC 50983]